MNRQEPDSLSSHEATILPHSLIKDLRSMIDQTKETIAMTVNSRLTLLYWQVGSRIRSELLNNERAEYVAKLSPQCRDNCRANMVKDLLRRAFGE